MRSTTWGTLYKLCVFPVRHIPISVRMCIPFKDESQWSKDPHWEWRCALPEMGCASLGMGMSLIGNAHPHRESISLPGMHIVHTGRIEQCLHQIKAS